ncbi:hypothetical protein [Pseudonocardia sp.]|jgi:hypothetical protein|uniref:hypothetical protein n=1 Tax=Pseudonocardia sp. TaxID=60912 RepID=UPI0031FDD064
MYVNGQYLQYAEGSADPAVLRFSQAMCAGLRTAAVVVLVIGALVIAWLPRRSRQGTGTAG